MVGSSTNDPDFAPPPRLHILNMFWLNSVAGNEVGVNFSCVHNPDLAARTLRYSPLIPLLKPSRHFDPGGKCLFRNYGRRDSALVALGKIGQGEIGLAKRTSG